MEHSSLDLEENIQQHSVGLFVQKIKKVKRVTELDGTEL